MDRVDRKMKHILLVLREPFLDRIPSLKTLVWFLLNHNHRITLITSESNKFILLSFDHENLQIIKVKQRSKRFESPTTLKLLWKTLSFLSNDFTSSPVSPGLIISYTAEKLSKATGTHPNCIASVKHIGKPSKIEVIQKIDAFS